MLIELVKVWIINVELVHIYGRAFDFVEPLIEC